MGKKGGKRFRSAFIPMEQVKEGFYQQGLRGHEKGRNRAGVQTK